MSMPYRKWLEKVHSTGFLVNVHMHSWQVPRFNNIFWCTFWSVICYWIIFQENLVRIWACRAMHCSVKVIIVSKKKKKLSLALGVLTWVFLLLVINHTILVCIRKKPCSQAHCKDMKEITAVSLQPSPKFNVIFFLKIGGLMICRTGIRL